MKTTRTTKANPATLHASAKADCLALLRLITATVSKDLADPTHADVGDMAYVREQLTAVLVGLRGCDSEEQSRKQIETELRAAR